MELHHKLRRDPSWHPSGCNICGQVQHATHSFVVGIQRKLVLAFERHLNVCTTSECHEYAMQLGHQAINCTNGTINWKQIYGEESFKLKTPVYPSEYDAVAKAKQVNVDKLKKLAEEWKNVCPLPCTFQSTNSPLCLCPLLLIVLAGSYTPLCIQGTAPHMRHCTCGVAAVQTLKSLVMREDGSPLTETVPAGSR